MREAKPTSRISTDGEMDEGSSSPRPLGPAEEHPGDGDDPDSPGSGGFLSRLLRRASHALQHGEGNLAARLDEVLHELGATERAMILNILRLRDQRVSDVMTPRADIVAVAADASLDEVMAAFEKGSLSRLPVYRGTLDDPLGFVHLKDLALAYGVGRARPGRRFQLTDHVRRALFVPPSMRVTALLQRMQAERIHMALVIDEFGGVDGLVTIEDLVEEIVGEIEDEHDTGDDEQWREEAPGVYIVSARAEIREFEDMEGVELMPADWEEEVDTFGGLVFMLGGRIPAKGEVIPHPAGHEFEVIDADARRVKRLRLTLKGAGHAGTDGARTAAE